MANPSGPPTNFDTLQVAGVPTIGASGLPLTNGQYWFVNSVTGSDGNPGNASNSPFATTKQAMAAATTGDVIVWQQGHAEAITAAGGITVAKTGLTFAALGAGATRPTFTFTGTASTFLVTGASTAILGNILATNVTDQIVSPFVIQAADCTFGTQATPVEWRDKDSTHEAFRAVLTTAAADRLNINLTYNGQTGGTHCVNAVRLVGCDIGNINVDFYGKASTGVVEFATTLCTNIEVTGYFYNSGTTNFSKNVVDTITGSTWYANGWDGAAGAIFDGGSGSAIGSNDPAAVLSISENVAVTTAAVLTQTASPGVTLFTIAGGPIEVVSLFTIVATVAGATATTIQYVSNPTLGAATLNLNAACTTLSGVAAGTTITLSGTSAATASVINLPNSATAQITTTTNRYFAQVGNIAIIVGGASNTGTFQHYLRYKPLAKGVTVTAAF